MNQDHDTTLPGLIELNEDQLGTPGEAARAKLQQQALVGSGVLRVDLSLCDIWPGNTRDTTVVAEEKTSELETAIEKAGQQVPVVARISPHELGRYEVVAGARRLTVIRKINEARAVTGEPPLPILLELREMDDRAAFELMEGENRGRSELAPIEKARSYAFAVEQTYGTQEALAEALGLNKSNVYRTMTLLDLPPALLDVIADPRRVSAAQASRFMADWRKAPLQPTLQAMIDQLGAGAPVEASAAFKALKDAVSADEHPAVVSVAHDGQEIGQLRLQPSGKIQIELSLEGRQLGVTRASEAIRAALRSLIKVNV